MSIMVRGCQGNTVEGAHEGPRLVAGPAELLTVLTPALSRIETQMDRRIRWLT